ncbi:MULTISPECIES: acyl-CoA thioesterase [Marinobacter]|uniref:TesB-like acyl-CoA thioesterase 1 n=1 Tax=Marinobacter excellens LAMA 842 TaxID=1306954 RepID=A0A137S679_9GAMM|nr:MULTISPECIES: thioesterase family protein [Marinobacter]KXO07939.1 TesB-like acyl-CoA thioesterase 1 [Marinobacter excellens LAMA 842]MCD1630131.1 thioesterase family protein [Marinobacter shengliensis]
MTFDELLNSVREGRDVVIPASWGQGRATFGGLVAALAFDVMASKVAPGRAMRAMQVSFVGPVEPDVPAVFEAELLREGKAVSQVQGRILQNGETRLACLASFGGDRESSVQVAPSPAPEAVPVDQCQALPYIPGVTPEFTQHIDMRWAFGNMPFSGKGGREMGGWMQFRETPSALTDAHIVALVDAWPPALLPHLKGPAPASSLSWALEIVHPRPTMKPGEWLLYRATIDQAGAGYGHTHAGIWTESGELVALSRQTVTVFG